MDSSSWTLDSWRERPSALRSPYEDAEALERAAGQLSRLPPLVTSWEIERLKALLADAQEGRRFVLMGGDCAEMVADCQPAKIAAKLKILLQMSMVLVHGLHKPVVRLGRFAGQYAKPRSKMSETRDGVELPSYFGDLVNRFPFDGQSRRPDPEHLITCYHHAALTLNFVRALVDGGFADLHHPEQWDMSFAKSAGLKPEQREQYEHMSQNLADGLKLMEALGEARIEELSRVDFYTSHEGFNLHYESAQTRQVPHRPGWYDLSTHLPWIGERTRQLDGAHVELFRGVSNPIGVKLGPTADPGEVRSLADRLNPGEEPGRLVLITRLGAERVSDLLPPLIEALEDRPVLWVCDPMHGNTRSTGSGVKTRSYDAILSELKAVLDVHTELGTWLGGVHFELTGEDVTECIGGAGGPTEDQLHENYASACDPRLNYQQSLELAFVLARRLRG